MASPSWSPGTTKVQQIATLTVASSTNGHTFLIKLAHPSGTGSIATGAAVTMGTYTAGAGETTTTIANAIFYMLTTGSSAGSSGTGATATLTYNHEFVKALSFSQSSAVITVTANVAGAPFIFGASGGTGTLTIATTTANVGPYDWSVAGNWSTGVIPATGDVVTISGSTPIMYGLDQSGVADIAQIDLRGFSSTLGSINHPLLVDVATTLNVDMSGLAHICLTSTTTNVFVYNTGGGNGGQDPGLTLYYGVGTVITLLRVVGGNVYAAAAVLATTIQIDAGVLAGAWQATTFNQTGGEVYGPIAATTYNMDSGILIIEGVQTSSTTFNQNGGTVTIYADSAITSYNLRGGTLDLSNAKFAFTIGTLTMRQAARLLMNTATITVTTFTREGVFEYKGLDFGRAA